MKFIYQFVIISFVHNNELKAIGNKVRVARVLTKLTLKQLSGKTGIGNVTLSRIETGKRDITVNEIVKIANGTNKPISFFYKDEEVIENFKTYKILEYFDPSDYDK